MSNIQSDTDGQRKKNKEEKEKMMLMTMWRREGGEEEKENDGKICFLLHGGLDITLIF